MSMTMRDSEHMEHRIGSLRSRAATLHERAEESYEGGDTPEGNRLAGLALALDEEARLLHAKWRGE